MRAAFAHTLTELAGLDSRILLLTGDLGFMALEPFSDRFPQRFFNAGVAEQNMVGMATGLAEAGFIPFVYSIVTFATLRPYEFIRNGPILHNLPVRVAGIGGGFEYGTAGPTHHGLEDVGVFRVQPGMTVVAPADHLQARTALLATWDIPGPIYYRLGKDDRTSVPGLDGRFELGRAQTLRYGRDVALITMGSISAEVARAAELLATQGIEATVVVVASINPPPVPDLIDVLTDIPLAVTVEAHFATGGVGSLVAEVIAENGLHCLLRRAGVRGIEARSGSQTYMHEVHGLTPTQIARTVVETLSQRVVAG